MSLVFYLRPQVPAPVDASAAVDPGDASASGGGVVGRVLVPVTGGSAVASGGTAGEGAKTTVNPGDAVAAGGAVVARVAAPVSGGAATASGGAVLERAAVPVGPGSATAGGGAVATAGRVPVGPGAATADGETVAGTTGSVVDASASVGPGSATASGGTVAGSTLVIDPHIPPDDDEPEDMGGGGIDVSSYEEPVVDARAYVRPGLAIASGGPVRGHVRQPSRRRPLSRRPAMVVDASARVRGGACRAAGGPVRAFSVSAVDPDEDEFLDLLASGALDTLLA